ncbi:MAG: hypothetical protein PHN55_14745 [Dysgonamonadaceae bacterium]|nr:hypothetical protein [Dysgonamonadaceae bacterium]
MKISVQQNGTLKCAYTYLADGTKVMVQNNANSSLSNGYLYLGSMVFKKTGTSYAFESTDFGGGRIINVNGTLSPYYYTTDHLGSVRVITDANGNVVERNDYYPFGKRMTTGNTYPTTSSNRWKYNGKEVQTTGDVNWLDYGAREYDEVIGRFVIPDAYASKYMALSPYQYAAGNPVMFIDFNGDSLNFSSTKVTDPTVVKNITNDLQSQTGLTLTLDPISGQMTYATTTDKRGKTVAVVATDANGKKVGSRTARKMITEAIDNKNTVNIYATNKMGSVGGGLQININSTQINQLILGTSSNLDAKTMGFGMTFLHEFRAY